jgi:hypothetical protein
VNWSWDLLVLPVRLALKQHVRVVVIGFGPSVHRHFGKHSDIDVRIFPLGWRLSGAWPARAGHARRMRIIDWLDVAMIGYTALPLVWLTRGWGTVVYAVFLGTVFVGTCLLTQIPLSSPGPLVRRLVRPPRAAEWDTPAGLARLREANGYLALRHGDFAAVRAIADRGGSEADTLRVELMAHQEGRYDEALVLFDRAPTSHLPRHRAEAAALHQAQLALLAAEAGQLPTEEAVERARAVLKQVNRRDMTTDAFLTGPAVRALVEALGPASDQALRLARGQVRGTMQRLHLAHAYCTLAHVEHRLGQADQAAAHLAQAHRLVPDLARARG